MITIVIYFISPKYSPLIPFLIFLAAMYFLEKKRLKLSGSLAVLGLVVYGLYLYPRMKLQQPVSCPIKQVTMYSPRFNITKTFDKGHLLSRELVANFKDSRINYVFNLTKETEWIHYTVVCEDDSILKYSVSRNDRLFVGHEFGDGKSPELPAMFYYDDGQNHYHGRLLDALQKPN